MSFVISGAKLRLHFNRHGAAPLVWCVATDDFEIAVKGFRVFDVGLETVYITKATPDDEDGKPSAWLRPATHAQIRVTITAGWAYLCLEEKDLTL